MAHITPILVLFVFSSSPITMSLSPLSFQQPSIHLFGWDREEDVELPLMFQVGNSCVDQINPPLTSLKTHTSAFSSSSPPLQADQYFTFVDFEDSDTTPTSDSKQNKKDQKIGRPPNSFLLFRRDFQAREAKKLPANSKRPTCASWSSKASAAWREMDTATRKRWEDMAATEKALHTQLHPDYKFRPNKRRKNEKNAHAPTAQPCSASARPSSSPLSRSTSSSSSDSPSTPGPLSRTTSTSSSSWDFDVGINLSL